MAPQQFRKFRRASRLRHEFEDAVPIKGDNAIGRIAELDRRSSQAVEHRVEVERRATDDLQHVGGRSLLLQRLAQVIGLGLYLVEQPRVLDGDRRLIGESLNELDLAWRKGFGLGTPEAENSDQLVFAHQGDYDDGAISAHV